MTYIIHLLYTVDKDSESSDQAPVFITWLQWVKHLSLHSAVNSNPNNTCGIQSSTRQCTTPPSTQRSQLWDEVAGGNWFQPSVNPPVWTCGHIYITVIVIVDSLVVLGLFHFFFNKAPRGLGQSPPNNQNKHTQNQATNTEKESGRDSLGVSF